MTDLGVVEVNRDYVPAVFAVIAYMFIMILLYFYHCVDCKREDSEESDIFSDFSEFQSSNKRTVSGTTALASMGETVSSKRTVGDQSCGDSVTGAVMDEDSSDFSEHLSTSKRTVGKQTQNFGDNKQAAQHQKNKRLPGAMVGGAAMDDISVGGAGVE